MSRVRVLDVIQGRISPSRQSYLSVWVWTSGIFCPSSPRILPVIILSTNGEVLMTAESRNAVSAGIPYRLAECIVVKVGCLFCACSLLLAGGCLHHLLGATGGRLSGTCSTRSSFGRSADGLVSTARIQAVRAPRPSWHLSSEHTAHVAEAAHPGATDIQGSGLGPS